MCFVCFVRREPCAVCRVVGGGVCGNLYLRKSYSRFKFVARIE